MPKPINPTVGSCPCVTAYCDEVADVRRQKGHPNGALYLHCPACHTVRMTGPAYQAWIQAHATWTDPGTDPGTPPGASTAPVLAPAPAPVQAPKPPAPPAPVPKPPAPARSPWAFDLEDL